MTDHFDALNQTVPKCIKLSAENFDALQRRLYEPGQYDPRVARVLSTPAPWDDDCDKTSTSADK